MGMGENKMMAGGSKNAARRSKAETDPGKKSIPLLLTTQVYQIK